jgi:hypothetical protein
MNKPVEPNASPNATWDVLREIEDGLVKTRRAAAYSKSPDRDALPRAGIALSGGGVRSATFCLGLLRGLAQNGVLRRFDYLSTVSGGGYIGSCFGRLAARLGIDKAEAELSAGDSLLLAWLRRNGRYLTPAGARDFGMAIATYLRGGLSTHLEIGILALLIGVAAIAPHVIQTRLPLFAASAWQSWWSGWWPVSAAAWLLFAPGGIVAFWPLRESQTARGRTVSQRAPWPELIVLSAIAAAGVWLTLPEARAAGDDAVFGPPSIRSAALLVFTGTLVRLLSVTLRLVVHGGADSHDAFAAEKNRLTRSLRRVNQTAAALFALGFLDLVTWTLEQQLSHVGSSWVAGGIGLGSLVALLLRTFSDPLQKISASADGVATRWLPQIVNIVGIGIGLLVLCLWTLLLQWLVFAQQPILPFQFLPPFARAGLILGVVALWYLLTIRNRETVNSSSLHGFYQARLTRAYVSVGSTERFPDLEKRTTAGAAAERIASVTDVVPNDDVALDQYLPESAGGPIHLISACLNQTVDDHGELYNADRKGAAIVASARGFEIGTSAFVAKTADSALGTLGHWVATSGAATSPGAGSYTTTGWALLLFLAGARLGYWTDAGKARAASGARADHGWVGNTLARLSVWLQETKPGLLGSEAFASFGGRTRRWWYLSDGGHFDNTGVYTLLRREVDFILLADCGADPKFEFGDLENLVRKARIDFDAEIEVYTHAEANDVLANANADLAVLSPEAMLNNQSVRGVLMARICYHRTDPARRKLGTLLIVKPNLHEALDNDVLAYARRNPAFPQQSTADQFFDEAQWESYHHLGEDFGRALTASWLEGVPGWSAPVVCPKEVTSLRRCAPPPTTTETSTVPFWRRGASATALSATLGIGAIGTLLVPGWQMFDDVQKERSAQIAQDLSRKQSANDKLAKLEPVIDKMLDLHEKSGKWGDDVSSSVGEKLNELYETTEAFPQDPQLRYVSNFVGEVQAACGVKASICPEIPAVVETLCNAVCTNPIIRADDPYWSYWPASDGLWTQNPIAHLAVRWHLLSEPDAGTDVTSTAANAAPALPQASLPATPAPVTASTEAAQTADRSAEATLNARDYAASPTAPTTSTANSDTRVAAAPRASAARREPSARAGEIGVLHELRAAPPAADIPTAAEAPPEATASSPHANDQAATRAFDSCVVDGQPITVFVQIYDEVMRSHVEKVRGLIDHSQVRFAGIENVTRSAASRGEKIAAQWRQPTLIMHRESDAGCARAVARGLGDFVAGLYGPGNDTQIRVRSLPPSFKSDRHVLELWLPPDAPLAAAK